MHYNELPHCTYILRYTVLVHYTETLNYFAIQHLKDILNHPESLYKTEYRNPELN